MGPRAQRNVPLDSVQPTSGYLRRSADGHRQTGGPRWSNPWTNPLVSGTRRYSTTMPLKIYDESLETAAFTAPSPDVRLGDRGAALLTRLPNIKLNSR